MTPKLDIIGFIGGRMFHSSNFAYGYEQGAKYAHLTLKCLRLWWVNTVRPEQPSRGITLAKHNFKMV